MMQTLQEIRLGGVDDLPAVARVHLDSARAAYRGISPGSAPDGLTLEGRLALWRTRFDGLGPDGRLWVVERDGVIGFASADQVGGEARQCELLSFYVAPDWWGKKVGHALMEWVLDDFRARNFDVMLLWTIGTNSRARDFYEKAGFLCEHRTRTIARQESGVRVAHDEVKYSRDLRG
jgi:GNAT superfamily N-acetyltransferase